MHADPAHVDATRRVYSESAGRFAATVGTTVSDTFEAPLDRAILATFIELCRASSQLAVDAGCGTGRIARHLVDGGLEVVGVDVAPGMIAEARRAHPRIEFEVADLVRLPFASASVGAIAYWYSIITTPPDALHDIWEELRRVLVPGGVAVVAFQCGEGDQVRQANANGTPTDLTLVRHDPCQVRSGLDAIGLTVHTFAQRRPTFAHESTDQTFIVATDER